eukprot:Clim_evm72s172 gene=Clim_evmTU72s172
MGPKKKPAPPPKKKGGRKKPVDEESDDDSETEVVRAGRRKISIEFIEDKSRRHITFSKRKRGIMKKAYELSTLTGTQVLLIVASETGHVYTFATPKLQPLITKNEGKTLIQGCLNAPDTPPEANRAGGPSGSNGHQEGGSYPEGQQPPEGSGEGVPAGHQQGMYPPPGFPYPPQFGYPGGAGGYAGAPGWQGHMGEGGDRK